MDEVKFKYSDRIRASWIYIKHKCQALAKSFTSTDEDVVKIIEVIITKLLGDIVVAIEYLHTAVPVKHNSTPTLIQYYLN